MTSQDDGYGPIAVIGMACRFPGAGDPTAFWRNLVEGRDSITRRPGRPAPGGGEYVPARGLVEDPEWFDADYFGYSPREARIIDPQHRLFLECAVEALEDAGHDPRRHSGAIGVYAGSTENSYGELLRSRRDRLPSVSDLEIRVATGADFLSSRVAYKLGLRGPSVTVQAACATSLVAVHLAARALSSGDCDLALAGGVTVRVLARLDRYPGTGIQAPDGICRAFDAAAQGAVDGDGAGVVVLRRLPEALADGDHVHAVLRGSAVNNDGADRMGYTAPGVGGQAAVIRAAQRAAGADAGTITYVEAHGTGTALGDPIEVGALARAYGP
ncbi:beta-ketoacyl [acyl carrier protein] synthase domain-containing protein, partial [Actinoallomurus acaciae]